MFKIALSQLNSTVGDLTGNKKKISAHIKKAGLKKAKIIAFPELALTGYIPLDLLNRDSFIRSAVQHVKDIQNHLPANLKVLLGTPWPNTHSSQKISNSILLMEKNKPLKVFSKEYLANEGIFDEKRYFSPGQIKNNHFKTGSLSFQVLICEDLWRVKNLNTLPFPSPALIFCLNSSPFYLGKDTMRKQAVSSVALKAGCPVVYLNMVGGQEDLIFDGGSFALSPKGDILSQSPYFKEHLSVFSLSLPSSKNTFASSKNFLNKKKSPPSLYKKTNPNTVTTLCLDKNSGKTVLSALILGIRDFLKKNQFKNIHLGLSGGIDSALTAWLAKKAVGEENLKLFFLPGPYTTPASKTCAKQTALCLKTPLHVYSIVEPYHFTLKSLKSFYKKNKITSEKNLNEVTRENIQARLRGMFLMGYANEHPGSMLLGTSNKSELAMGYGTLYGDLIGCLFPLGDLLKSEICSLVRLVSNPTLPKTVLTRTPSAELKPNQTDEQDLMPYSTLDPLLQKLIEKPNPLAGHKTPPAGSRNPPAGSRNPPAGYKNLQQGNKSQKTETKNIEQKNQEKDLFHFIIKNEFKRRQSPPVLKIKSQSFDRGWRWPLSCRLRY